MERFSRELQRPLSESTVRGFKKAYYSELKKVKDPDKVQELPHGARGKPNKLGDLDQKVQAYIRKLRAAGTPVSRSIVIAVTAPRHLSQSGLQSRTKRHFTNWYAGEIEKGLREGKEVKDVKVDFRLSAIKPIHAKWLMDVHAIMNEKSDLIHDGFRKS